MMQSDFRFSPLQNGLEFLLSSLEHLTSASSVPTPLTPLTTREAWIQKRHLKYALLHLCSSIEVLFKVRLKQEHWSLVFANVNKADNAAQDDGEFESVAFNDLVDRLVRICRFPLSDEQRRLLTNLRKRRNRMEHFGAVDSLLALTASVSTMVSFTVDFVESAFRQEVIEEERPLIDEIRAKLGSCAAFIGQRWNEIRNEVNGFYSVIECPTCQQPALEVEAGSVKCRFCYHSANPEEAANDYIARVLGYQSRYAVENAGGEWPLHVCPECGNNALVTRIAKHGAFCFNCGKKWATEELSRCRGCTMVFVADDDGIGICANCSQVRMSKD
jgi:hypothetical protein